MDKEGNQKSPHTGNLTDPPQPYAGKVTSLRHLAGELTTEIYTLSLHDALPISDFRCEGFSGFLLCPF